MYDLILIAVCTSIIFTIEQLRRRDRAHRAQLLASEARNRILMQQIIQAQKMEAIGRLAGGIAHDFNNLLTAILGVSELLLADLPPGTQPHSDVLEILTVSRRASTLTRQLLSFARQQIIQPRRVNLNHLLLEVAPLLRRLVTEGVELAFVPADTIPPVIADPAQLEQVLVNLAVNARDAMPAGGRLLISTAVCDLPDPPGPGLLPGQWVMVSVQDTGTGMPPEVLERAMEPFFTTKDKTKGTGLGLATSYGIMQQHGGTIRLQSVLGVGTTVELLLPPAARSPLPDRTEEFASAADTENGQIVPGSGTILLVEDDAAVRGFARRALAAAGYTVVTAVNGADAILQLEGNSLRGQPPLQVDLVLSDVVMPLINGPQLASELGRRYPGLPIVMMSGYTDNTITHAGVVDAGVTFIQKPFTAATLSTRLAAILNERRQLV